jgi:GNAT superfamily N-acetyltransferase
MVEIRPLKPQAIPKIIERIQEKWKIAKKQYPLLPDFFKSTGSLQILLREIIQSYPAFGAYSKDQLLSFILGYSEISTFKGKEKGSFVPFWGYEWNPARKMLFFRLYQRIATTWVKSGILNHCISYFPIKFSFQNFLFQLGFGLLVIDAIRSTNSICNSKKIHKAKVRSVKEDDLRKIHNLGRSLSHNLTLSPTFLYNNIHEEKADIREYLSSKTKTFIIEKDGKIIAGMRGTIAGSNFIGTDKEDTLTINFAFCHPNHRRQGFSRILLDEILKWGRYQHLKRCTVDFESANYLGAKFWLRYFKPISYNVIRKIDNRFENF